MHSTLRLPLAAALALASVAACTSMAPKTPMSFFVTSTGSGQGENFSASAVGATPAVDARDRIGSGPWRNAKGEVIANDVAELHASNNLTKQTALTEKGTLNNGRGDTPNQHDILTGSTPDGRATEATCNNWTSNSNGSAIVGHHDRTGLDESAPAKSWNASHPSRACSDEALRSSGGAGQLYCFAAD
jgi:hypothetical protein